MSWTSDDGLHEGYLVPEFGDGQRGSGIATGQVAADEIIVEVDYGHGPDESAVFVTRPAGEVVAWRIVCDCHDAAGNLRPEPQRWVSDPLVRVPSVALEQLDSGCIFAADTDVIYVNDRDDVSDMIHSRWKREHADQHGALGRITAARVAAAAAELELIDAVSAARSTGATWELIGNAAGITRQTAHTRWG